jgi:hypothetical protein
MRASDVKALVEREIGDYRYDPPEDTLGIPWTSERVASELGILRESLVEPRLAEVEIADNASPGPVRQLWIVTRSLDNGYLVVFDPESRDFGLAVEGEIGPPQTVAVWGDFVGSFMAR